MLARSHNPFVSKILPLSLYSAKILTVFTAQIFDSTRGEGEGGYPFPQELSVALRCQSLKHSREETDEALVDDHVSSV